MATPTLPVKHGDAAPERTGDGSAVRVLPSGRSIVARVGDEGEAIEVRSPEGTLELRVALTDDGPVLALHGARLELVAPETVAVRCGRFEVETASGVSLRAAGDIELESRAEIRTRTAGSTWIDGEYVNLNCRERAGYPDDPAPEELPAHAAEREEES